LWEFIKLSQQLPSIVVNMGHMKEIQTIPQGFIHLEAALNQKTFSNG
jgi:hypothetical protein